MGRLVLTAIATKKEKRREEKRCVGVVKLGKVSLNN